LGRKERRKGFRGHLQRPPAFPSFLSFPPTSSTLWKGSDSRMRLSNILSSPLRLPKTLRETLRLLPSPSPSSSSSSSSSSSESSPSPPSVVQGWISSLRTSKNVAFIGLNDGTLDRPLQVVVLGKKTVGGMRRSVQAQNPLLLLSFLLSSSPLCRYSSFIAYLTGTRYLSCSIVEELSIGASLKITGPIIPSPGPGQPVELQASALEVLGSCDGEVSSELASYPSTSRGPLRQSSRLVRLTRTALFPPPPFPRPTQSILIATLEPRGRFYTFESTPIFVRGSWKLSRSSS